MAIVRMKNVQVLGAADLHRNALDLLQELGVMEIQRAGGSQKHHAARRALLLLLEKVEKVGQLGYPAQQPGTSSDDLIGLSRRLLEELEALEQERAQIETALDRQRIWGDTSPEQLAALSENDVHVQCWTSRDPRVFERLRDESDAEVFLLERQARNQIAFCTIRSGEPMALDHARITAPPVALPGDLERRRDETQAKISTVAGVITWIAREHREDLANQIEAAHDALRVEEVRSDMHLDDHVFALTGWLPEAKQDEVRSGLDRLPGVTARFRDPYPAEDPPTLIQYPAWVRPIQSILDLMGYRSGYREYDAGHWMIVFFTVFSALLINDGGYGLLLLVLLLGAYKPLVRLGNREIVHLGLYVAVATAVFGLWTGAFFGVQATTLGSFEFVKFDTDSMIKISFALGILHLSVGRILHAWSYGVDLRALAELGWLAILWGVYLGIVNVFTGSTVPASALPLMIGGSIAVVLFSFTDRGLGKGQLYGLGSLLGNATTVFSDVMSYIRLMAVGFASMSLAMTSNTIASQTGSLLLGIPILIIGHGINLGLGMIALFVHGLRLNTLEFSRQMGVQWTGRAFRPFEKLNLGVNNGSMA